MYSFTYVDPMLPRVTQTCDSGAETAEAALASIRRFLGRERRRRRRAGIAAPRLPKHVNELRQWCPACQRERAPHTHQEG